MDSVSRKMMIACLHCKSLYKIDQSYLGKPVKCGKCQRAFLAEPCLNQPSGEDESLFLCKLALNYGLLDEKQLETALTEYAHLRSNPNVSIESVMVQLHLLSEENLDLLTDIRNNWHIRLEEKRYAQQAVKQGLISEHEARDLLVKQAIHFKNTRSIKRLATFMVEKGTLTETEHQRLLSRATAAPESVSPSPSPERVPPKPDQHMTSASTKHPPIAPEDKPTHQPRQPAAPTAPPASPSAVNPDEPPRHQDSPPIPDQAEQPKEPSIPPSPVTDYSGKPEPDATQKAPEHDAAPHNDTPTQPTEPTPKPVAPDIMLDTKEPSQPKAPPASPEESDDSIIQGNSLNINGLELIISEDKVTALLRAPKDIEQTSATIDSIKDALRQEGIIFGVVETALIQGFLNSKIFREKPFKIAEGKHPKPGVKGEIKYHFDTDYLKIGAMTESGNIDFKNRGEIPHVKAGALLAEITPAVQGKDGVDIYGNPLLVPAVEEITIRCEKGADFSEDRKKIYATIDGQPKLNFGDRISVLSELSVKGDVGFETGHIDFQGNVVVKGAVQSDFNVKAASIKAREVLAANIEATGDLEVADGISGATITVQGNLKAKYIHKSTITAFGDVLVQKEIIDCRITNSGGCYIERGKIISSEISSKQGIEALEIGTEMSTPCTLKIGVDDHINDEIKAIEESITATRESLEKIRTTLETLSEEEKETHKHIADLAHVQDRSQLELKDLRQELESAKESGDTQKVSDIEKRMETLDATAREADSTINNFFDRQDQLMDEINGLKQQEEEYLDRIDLLKREKKDLGNWSKQVKSIPNLTVQKTIFAGTTIIGTNTSKVLKEPVKKVKIREIRSSDSPDGWELRIN